MGLRNHTGLMAAVAVLLAASACGGSGGGAREHKAAGHAAAKPYDANALKAGLLTTYQKTRPAGPASAGTIGVLQDRLGLARQLAAIKTRERECLTAGPNLTSPNLRAVPASAVTFADARHGFTLGEVLFSTGAAAMRALVDKPIPASCRQLTAKVKQTAVRVTLRPISMPKAAYPARGVVTTVLAGGKTQRSLTMMFATERYGGTLSLSGPKAGTALLHQAADAAIRAADRKLA